MHGTCDTLKQSPGLSLSTLALYQTCDKINIYIANSSVSVMMSSGFLDRSFLLARSRSRYLSCHLLPPSHPFFGAKSLAQNAQPLLRLLFSSHSSPKYPSESRRPLPPRKNPPPPPSPKVDSIFSFFCCPCVTLVVLFLSGTSRMFGRPATRTTTSLKSTTSLSPRTRSVRASSSRYAIRRAKTIICYVYHPC